MPTSALFTFIGAAGVVAGLLYLYARLIDRRASTAIESVQRNVAELQKAYTSLRDGSVTLPAGAPPEMAEILERLCGHTAQTLATAYQNTGQVGYISPVRHEYYGVFPRQGSEPVAILPSRDAAVRHGGGQVMRVEVVALVIHLEDPDLALVN